MGADKILNEFKKAEAQLRKRYKRKLKLSSRRKRNREKRVKLSFINMREREERLSLDPIVKSN